MSLLTGPDRQATCSAAGWLTGLTLDDGAHLSGVMCTSKHGGDLPCWALWVDLLDSDDLDDLERSVGRRVVESSQGAIDASNADFKWAAKSLGLYYH